MKQKLKVIQLAAYQSNIGDNANISGFRDKLECYFEDYDVVFTDLDLVNFSWNLDQYTNDTIELINSHDLFVIGGGGFFELIPGTDTWTGTRINIPKETFDKIKPATLFFAVGIDTVRADLDGRDISQEVEKFKSFVDYVHSNERMLLSTRHDGSLGVIQKLLGDDYVDKFVLAPDGGFFSTYSDCYHPELAENKINIAINYGGDLLDARFPMSGAQGVEGASLSGVEKPSDYELNDNFYHQGFNRFNTAFCNVLKQLYQESNDFNFIFVPHIYRDIEVGFQMINELDFPINRRATTAAPYLSGFKGKDYIVDLYKKCDLTIGMRFHANICPIGLGTPSIGLETFPILGPLYKSLGIAEQNIIAYHTDDLEERLYNKIKNTLKNSASVRKQYSDIKNNLNSDIETVFERLSRMISQ